MRRDWEIRRDKMARREVFWWVVLVLSIAAGLGVFVLGSIVR